MTRAVRDTSVTSVGTHTVVASDSTMPRIAVIGGGIGACSLAHGLAAKSTAASVHLFEMGRGTGGRAATRMTREKPGLRVDHGVPSFAAYTPAFTALCERLVETNALQRCGGGVENGSAFGVLTADGRFEAEDAASAPNRYRAPEGKGINSLCDALLRGGDGAADAPPIAQTTLGTMVSKVEPIPLSAGLQSPPRHHATTPPRTATPPREYHRTNTPTRQHANTPTRHHFTEGF